MVIIKELAGQPCHVCGKPGVRVVNLAYTHLLDCSAPADMQSCCEDHTPVWFAVMRKRQLAEQEVQPTDRHSAAALAVVSIFWPGFSYQPQYTRKVEQIEALLREYFP